MHLHYIEVHYIKMRRARRARRARLGAIWSLICIHIALNSMHWHYIESHCFTYAALTVPGAARLDSYALH